MDGDNNKIDNRPEELSAWWLLLAFFYFVTLSGIFLFIYGLDRIYLGPQAILIMFVNYIPLVYLPWSMALGTKAGIGFLGLDKASFKRTLPYGIPAFVIASIWQSGVFGFSNYAYYPGWDVFLLVFGILFTGILIPIIEIKWCLRRKLVPGLITLSCWAIYLFFFPWGDESTTDNIVAAKSNPMNYLLISILISIAVPFAEETFFRGFILRFFQVRYHPVIAIYITAIIFGTVHGDPSRLISLTLFSVAIGMLVAYSKSLYPALSIWLYVPIDK
jgi:hypothetical protein